MVGRALPAHPAQHQFASRHCLTCRAINKDTPKKIQTSICVWLNRTLLATVLAVKNLYITKNLYCEERGVNDSSVITDRVGAVTHADGT